MKKKIYTLLMVLYSIFMAYHLFINLIGGVPAEKDDARLYVIEAFFFSILLSVILFYALYCTFFVWKPFPKKEQKKVPVSFVELFCTLDAKGMITDEEKMKLKKILNKRKPSKE